MAITIPVKGQTDWAETLNAALIELESEIGENAAKVNGVTVSGTPTTGQVLTATGTTSATWQSASGVGSLLIANNLSDLASAPTARTNLGLGTAATANTTAFDAAGSAASAQANAIADAVTKYSPLRLDVFNVMNYNAKGDGAFVVDGVANASSAIITSASNPWSPSDVTKSIIVVGAGATGITSLVTTIDSYQSAGQVTLATNAVTSISNCLIMWATDDTAAIQAAINAARAYGLLHGSATVYFPVGSGLFYGVAGALTTTHFGHSQLYLDPVVTVGNKVGINFVGVGNGSLLQHWQQKNPQVNGSTIVSFGVFSSIGGQSTAINTFGNASVIGGPTQPNGYGTSAGAFANMGVTFKDISILTTHSTFGLGYSAGDMSGIANCNLFDFAYGATASPALLPSIDAGVAYANGTVIGWLMPANGNNDNCAVRNVTCHGGYTFGFLATEHTLIDAMRILYCWSGFCPVGNYFGSAGATHAIKALQLSIEACTVLMNIFGIASAGVGPIVDVDQLDTEISTPTILDRQSGAALATSLGTIKITGLFNAANISVAPTGIKFVNGQKAYPVVSKSTNYTVTVLDNTILVDATSGPVTITLISAAYTANTFTVKKTDNSVNAVTVAAQGGQNIDGSSTFSLPSQNNSVTVIPSASNWFTI